MNQVRDVVSKTSEPAAEMATFLSIAGLMTWLGSRRTRQLAVLLIVAASFAFSIVYTSIQTHDQNLLAKGAFSDTEDYIALYRGQPASPHHAYRLLTPWLARAMLVCRKICLVRDPFLLTIGLLGDLA